MDFRISEFGLRISNFYFSNSQARVTTTPAYESKSTVAGFQIRIPIFKIPNLPFRELEALAGALLPILLSFLDAGIASD